MESKNGKYEPLFKLSSVQNDTTHVENYSCATNDKLSLKKTFKNDKLVNIKLIGKGPHDSKPVIVKDSFIEYIKNVNPFMCEEGHEKHYEDIHKCDIEKAIDEKRVYFIYNSGHVLFDFNGNPVPLIQNFDYINLRLRAENIDIDKAKSVLEKHPWVKNLIEGTVPYYNTDLINEKCLSIQILPDEESFNEIYKKSLEISEEFFSVIMQELIGGLCYNDKNFDPLKINKFRKYTYD